MTKVRIRQVISKTRWQLVTFLGPNKGESVGIVDLLAVRKNHRRLLKARRGDALQVILIQVKGGDAPKPTEEDAQRMRIVGQRLHATQLLLATWKKGSRARFFRLRKRLLSSELKWIQLKDLDKIFQ